MNNVETVKATESLGNLLDYLSCVPLVEERLRHNVIKQLATIKQFLNDINPFVILKRFENLKDVRVIDLSQNFDFIYDFLLFILLYHSLLHDSDASIARSLEVLTRSHFAVLPMGQ